MFTLNDQCLKWAGILRYTVLELLFVPELHTGTYQYIYIISLYIFPFFWRYILVSLLGSIDSSRFPFRAPVMTIFVPFAHIVTSLRVAIFSRRSRVSSVSIVSDYGLDDRAIGVRSPARAKDFSSILCVQTGSEAHLASCPMGTGGPFPGGKARAGVTLTTHPHLVPRSRMSRSYTSSPPKRLHGV
jgi:hypothetical protein